MFTLKRLIYTFSILLLLFSCQRNQPFVNKNFKNTGIQPGYDSINYSIYFMGNFTSSNPAHPNLQLLKNLMKSGNEKSATVLLGNYIYPAGLPDDEGKDFENARSELLNLLGIFQTYGGKKIFIPSNRDWENGGTGGSEKVKTLELIIEKYFENNNVFVPNEACPGPEEIELTNNITLITFDSQWWLQNDSKFSYNNACDFEDLETEEDYQRAILLSIRDALERNKDKQVIFATHHSLFSAGRHGGHFPPEENLFPLLPLNKNLWIPLPGFLYTGSRKFLGTAQDLAHPQYKEMRNSLQKLFKNYPNLVYLSSHDNNLQYTNRDSLHHIVSGAATNADYVSKNKNTDFAMQSTGIGKLNFYIDGEVWLEFVVPDASNGAGKTVFKTRLYTKKPNPKIKEEQAEIIDYANSIVVIKASEQYNVGKFKRLMMGENYRADWNQPVEFQVFDIGKEHGGLEITQRGGGQQTKSLRLEAANKHEYVLRSIEKYVEGALSEEFRGTVAVDIVQDGISQSNPYGALVVPHLADAAGVYHTNPRIVFVPDDQGLKIYRKEMANKLYLYEERAAGKRSDVASFGHPKDIKSTSKVLKKLKNQHDHRVDQQAVLKARLLDMLIADWDRHDDQWRWAEFEEKNMTIYKPIPRDRDNTFFVAKGPVNWLMKRKWLQPKFQGFDSDTKHIAEFNFNARYFDRSFLNMATLEQWNDAAEIMQTNLTDEVIENAVRNGFPEPIYELCGTDITEKLKSRRDNLPKFAREHYAFLAKTVDIPGTDDRDLFVIERMNDNETKVTGWELSQKKGHIKDIFYQRTFKTDETKEIRIYGQKDQDKFVVNGNVNKGIKVRIIGGKDRDTIIDNSHVKGQACKTIIYDKKRKSNFIKKSKETKDLRSNRGGVNDYNRKLFKYNLAIPQAYLGYSVDDGVFIGGGVYLKRFHFRDSTFHRIVGNYAYETDAFNIRYAGLVSSFIRSLDLMVDADISAPNVVGNFYGLGNETLNQVGTDGDEDREYYRVRYHYGLFSPQLRKTINDELEFLFGASAVFGKIERSKGRFIDDLENNGLTKSAFLDQYLAGISASFNYDQRDDEKFPTRGTLWHLNARRMYGLNSYSGNFTELSSDLSLYLSLRKNPRMIVALRFGGGKSWGDYPFYMAQGLGDKTNLRGFRANRFAGDAAFYQNTELRLKLFRINTYLLNGNLGILGFNDVGRVWYEGEKSEQWHHGYGFGLWMIPYNVLTLSVNMNFSTEEKYLNIRLSYLF